MTVIVLERVSPSLRGYLSRWLIEVRTGTFVGNLSQRVRENVWEEICCNVVTGAAFVLYSSDCEQGYRCEFWGATSRRLRDFDGLQLIEIYNVSRSQALKAQRVWSPRERSKKPGENELQDREDFL